MLAGAIDLASLVLPDKTLDSAVDLATRLPLFKNGSNILNIKIEENNITILENRHR